MHSVTLLPSSGLLTAYGWLMIDNPNLLAFCLEPSDLLIDYTARATKLAHCLGVRPVFVSEVCGVHPEGHETIAYPEGLWRALELAM